MSPWLADDPGLLPFNAWRRIPNGNTSRWLVTCTIFCSIFKPLERTSSILSLNGSNYICWCAETSWMRVLSLPQFDMAQESKQVRRQGRQTSCGGCHGHSPQLWPPWHKTKGSWWDTSCARSLANHFCLSVLCNYTFSNYKILFLLRIQHSVAFLSRKVMNHIIILFRRRQNLTLCIKKV